MTKSTQIFAALALSLAATAPAHADDGLALRIAMSAGSAIAAQGNAALAAIRQDIKDTVIEQLKPFLPAATPALQQPAPAKR